MDKKLISCAFNIDTARVEVNYADGLTFDPIYVMQATSFFITIPAFLPRESPHLGLACP